MISEQFILAALEEEKTGNPFPFDFDDVWPAAGYSNKGNGLRLLKSDFSEGTDYRLIIPDKSGFGGGSSPNECSLSVDAFKAFLLMARTEEGKSTRDYFISVEKAYRRNLNLLLEAPALETIPTGLADLYRQLADVHTEN